jgi:hypothetical protein
MNIIQKISAKSSFRSVSMALRNAVLNWSAAVLAAAVLFPSIPSAVAAPITWGTPTTVSGSGSQVVTTGTLFGAWTQAGNFNVTVNGVTFIASNSTTGFKASVGSNNSGGSPAGTGLSSTYATLLVGRAFTGNGSFTFSGLTPGQQYLIQVWSNASQSVSYMTGTTNLLANATGTAQVTLDMNNTGTTNGVGQFVTGYFTAESSGTQIVRSVRSGPNPNNAGALVNAIQIRAVPEPSTLAMAALGIGGAWAIIRRRSRRMEEDSSPSESVM